MVEYFVSFYVTGPDGSRQWGDTIVKLNCEGVSSIGINKIRDMVALNCSDGCVSGCADDLGVIIINIQRLPI